MRRYFKRAIAVLVIALMCSTLIGGGVLAEIESENDINNEVNVEEIGGNEDVPEISPEEKSGTVSGCCQCTVRRVPCATYYKE